MKIIKHRLLLFIPIFAVLLLGSCNDDEPDPVNSRTLLVYMAMNNSLSGSDEGNINSIIEGCTPAVLKNSRVLIYRTSTTESPELMEVVGGNIGVKTIKSYSSHNSASPTVIRAVIDDAKAAAPADNYGIIISSHGIGWLPEGAYTRGLLKKTQSESKPWWLIKQQIPGVVDIPTRDVIQDTGVNPASWTTLEQLSALFSYKEFEYIMFDACYMGEVEVAYALRDKAEYIGASSAEILAEGFPYKIMMKSLMSGNLSNACKLYYDYYSTSSIRWATIALYDCSKMEYLASIMRQIAIKYRADIDQFDVSNLQRFDRYNRHTMFDMQDWITSMVPSSDPLLNQFNQTLNEAIPYKSHVANGYFFAINKFCGMSSYIPVTQYADLNQLYFQTAWGARVFGE